MANSPRPFFVQTINTLCHELGIDQKATPDQWLMNLKYREKSAHIIGFTFPLNDAVTHKILKDKTALSTLLTHDEVPCVPHTLIVHPSFKSYVAEGGVWQQILIEISNNQPGYSPLKAPFESPVVLKANQGSGGRDVFVCHTFREVEVAVQSLFENHRQLVISPWVDAPQEYRLIVLEGKVLLSFGKVRGPDLQHNLSQEAGVSEIQDSELFESLQSLALNACKSTRARLGVVDILENTKGELQILEINGAVCLEKFSKKAKLGSERAKGVYSEILKAIFEIS